jgi:hypothetical protein
VVVEVVVEVVEVVVVVVVVEQLDGLELRFELVDLVLDWGKMEQTGLGLDNHHQFVVGQHRDSQRTFLKLNLE